MTPRELEELATLSDAASDGPWTVEPQTYSDVIRDAHGDYVAANYHDEAGGILGAADVALIVAARNALPALIAEVRRLTAPPAAEPTDRQLLVDVRRWAIANGWHLTWLGWANAATVDGATVIVEWYHGELVVSRRNQASGQWSASLFRADQRRHPVDSVREALDILVALGIVPARFSSAYRAALAVTR